MKTAISREIDTNIRMFNQLLHVGENFDILSRVVEIAGKTSCLYLIDGLNKDEILEKLMEFFYGITPQNLPADAHGFAKLLLPYGEVDLLNDPTQIVTMLLSGVPMLFVDGYDQALAIDFRTYPARGVEEPDKDKVLRGSKDGFVETIVFNTALIRRRIRNPDLIMEITSLGESSHTDVVLAYMKHRADPQFLKKVQEKLKSIRVDALTMNTESLAEAMFRKNWLNPFPKFKYTERPDTAAASILEGSIVILIDNSPSAIILPTTLFEITEEADDYYFPPLTGTYLRLSRMVINLIALFLTPLWLLLMYHPQWIPAGLSFIQITEEIHVPLLIQLFILEFAIDGLRLASMNTPSMLSTPLSVVAGIVLGDYTVSSGWFNAQTMLYMAFVAIANYSQASFELSYALKFLRLLTLLLTGLFDVWGFAAGILVTILALVTNRTLSGQSYLYPLIPFRGRELLRRFLRITLPEADRKK